MSYSATWERRALQRAVMPMLHGVADRWRPQIEEFAVDLAPGREVVFIVIPPPRVLVDCPTCWAQKQILEPGPLGLVAVLCPQCLGRGRV